MNNKNASSTYLKSDNQTMWARNAHYNSAGGKRKRNIQNQGDPELSLPSLQETFLPSELEGQRGAYTIVIHPGTRFVRIGRGSDTHPLNLPHVIARRRKAPSTNTDSSIHSHPMPSSTTFVNRIPRYKHPRGDVVSVEASTLTPSLPDNYAVMADLSDPLDMQIAEIRKSLRWRMSQYGLQALKDGSQRAQQSNRQARPSQYIESGPNARPPWFVEADVKTEEKDVLIGNEALRIADPDELGYLVRWPVRGIHLNADDYASRQEVIGDIQTIWTTILENNMGIPSRHFQHYSVILIIPDYWDKFYIRELTALLLGPMNFKRICLQQESLAASFAASLPTTCIVDIGASKTSISCIDDGMIVSESRMCLDFGGDDVSALFVRLLEGIDTPIFNGRRNERQIEETKGNEVQVGNKTWEWSMIEDLKARSATLAEVDVDIIPYDLIVHEPQKPMMSYSIKTYDEPNIASMLLFHPQIIDFNGNHTFNQKAAAEKGRDHLWNSSDIEDMDLLTDSITTAMKFATEHLMPSTSTSSTGALPQPINSEPDPTLSGDVDMPLPESTDPLTMASPLPTPKIEQDAPTTTVPQHTPLPTFVDVREAAGKTPLDLAIFNSIRASSVAPIVGPGGATNQNATASVTLERTKRLLQYVLVVGGTALTPGMLSALESRLKVLIQKHMPGLEEGVAVIPAPKEIDPRVLSWRGATVLSRLDSVAELWVQQEDWEMMGPRALRERTFFL